MNRAGLEQQEGRLAADAVGQVAKHADADHHADDRDRGPHGRTGQREAERPGQVCRQPDHDAVVAEILYRAQDDDADAGGRGPAVRHQQAEGIGHRRATYEHLRFMQTVADKPGDKGRNHADQEHAAPAYHGQQQRRQQRSHQDAGLPAERHVRGHAPALARRPGFCGQRHADTEFTAEPDAGNGAEHQQLVKAPRKRAKAGEHGKQDDGPGQHADASVAVAQCAEDDAAGHRADQRPGDQRAGLTAVERQCGTDGGQHKAEDEQIEAVHRIADGGARQRFPCVGGWGRFGHGWRGRDRLALHGHAKLGRKWREPARIVALE